MTFSSLKSEAIIESLMFLSKPVSPIDIDCVSMIYLPVTAFGKTGFLFSFFVF